ncbi:S8 family serine peptidase [Rhodoplanes sp. SY1]|uniref:S8 family serine peptidase n=1 Tax=Rhodoplanes sp. SY1 TaxID=3166646 RepID=UPI0038B449A1
MTTGPVRGILRAGGREALRLLAFAAVLTGIGGLGAAAQPADPRFDPRDRPGATRPLRAAPTPPPRAYPGQQRFLPPPTAQRPAAMPRPAAVQGPPGAPAAVGQPYGPPPGYAPGRFGGRAFGGRPFAGRPAVAAPGVHRPGLAPAAGAALPRNAARPGGAGLGAAGPGAGAQGVGGGAALGPRTGPGGRPSFAAPGPGRPEIRPPRGAGLATIRPVGPGRPGLGAPGRPGFGGPGFAGPGRPGGAGVGPYRGFRSPAAAAWAGMRHRFYVPPPRPVGPPPGLGIGRTAHERLYSGLPPQNETRFIPREVVVQVADTVPRAQIEAAARKHGITMMASHGFAGAGRTLYHFRTADGRDVRDVIRNLEREQVVAAAQPNYVYRLHQADAVPAARPAVPATPAVTIAPATPVSPAAAPAAPEPAAAAATEQPLPPGDPGQYVIEKLKLVEAHAQARGRNVAIAVIDSDVDARHPDMHGAVTERFDPSGTAAKPHLHGTGMAGAILARYRLRGIAPDASIVAVKAFDERSTAPEATTFQILKGIDHAMRRGVRVINMSFAGPHDVMIERKLQEAYDKGIVLVAAAGNAGPTSPPLYPAADPNVIAVTATDRGDAPLPQANRGKHLAVAAPGVDILAPAPGGAYQLTTGTSIAAAHVSGVVALVLEKRPDLTPDEVRAILVGSAAPITGTSETETGAGLVDPVKALTYEPEMPEEPAVASGTPAKPKTPAAAAAAATPVPSSTRTAPRPAAATGRAVP